MRTLSHKFLNAALYQVGWFCCMLIAEPLCGLITTALILTFHVSTGGECLKELSFIFTAATLGYSMDLALRGFGYIDLTVSTNGTAYLILLWVLFATSLRSSMLSILNHKKWALLLGISAPGAYWVGQNLGRVHYTEPLQYSLLIHALMWMMLMYLLYSFNKKFFPYHEKF